MMRASLPLRRGMPTSVLGSVSANLARPSSILAAPSASKFTSLQTNKVSVNLPKRFYSSKTPNEIASEAQADFDPHAITAMDKQSPPEPGADFNVVIVGAGNINFGSDEGPWNHSFRLEHKLGPRLKVVGLIDPSADRAAKVLDVKRKSFVLSAYKDTIVYPTFNDYVRNRDPAKPPHAFWVGSPPAFRGREESGRDLEKALVEAFPNAGIFIEKPVSTGPVDEAFAIAERLKSAGNIVSVGYMLRYLKVVQKMKQILEENNLKVMATNARYIMAYEHTAKLDWWDKSQTCGPIVEQATHFCDLSRYFGGEVDLDSVLAHSLEHFEPAGQLGRVPVPEETIAPEQRIPRITCATWKYTSGAVGSLTHAVALHGYNYSTELDIIADGHSLRLVDPYNAPVLYFRRPGDDHEEVVRYQSDDPFFSEVSNLIDNIELGPGSAPILSSYEDAVKTYALTWQIRNRSEEQARKSGKVPAGW
jgi:predicted dehydrogenase